MKAFANKVNKCFKKQKRNFVKFVLSLLANANSFAYIIEIFKHVFNVLLCKFVSDCKSSKEFLEEKIKSDIETSRELKADYVTTTISYQFPVAKSDADDDDELPQSEDVYLKQSKRSIFFKKCESIFKDQLDNSNSLSDLPDTDKIELYSPKFATYILNNWCGTLPLWTSLHLGDQGRHGSSSPYRK